MAMRLTSELYPQVMQPVENNDHVEQQHPQRWQQYNTGDIAPAHSYQPQNEIPQTPLSEYNITYKAVCREFFDSFLSIFKAAAKNPVKLGTIGITLGVGLCFTYYSGIWQGAVVGALLTVNNNIGIPIIKACAKTMSFWNKGRLGMCEKIMGLAGEQKLKSEREAKFNRYRLQATELAIKKGSGYGPTHNTVKVIGEVSNSKAGFAARMCRTLEDSIKESSFNASARSECASSRSARTERRIYQLEAERDRWLQEEKKQENVFQHTQNFQRLESLCQNSDEQKESWGHATSLLANDYWRIKRHPAE